MLFKFQARCIPPSHINFTFWLTSLITYLWTLYCPDTFLLISYTPRHILCSLQLLILFVLYYLYFYNIPEDRSLKIHGCEKLKSRNNYYFRTTRPSHLSFKQQNTLIVSKSKHTKGVSSWYICLVLSRILMKFHKNVESSGLERIVRCSFQYYMLL